MDGYISNKKNIYFVDGLEKFCRQRWRATQDLKEEAEHHRNLRVKLHLQDREEINLIATHPREIVPQDRRSNWRRQVGDQVRHRWREECVQVNHDSRYVTRFMLNTFYLIVASEGGVKGEWIKEDTKVVASVKTKNQRSLAKAKKMTKRKNKPTPKPWMV
jgi:hypothetical protein